MGCKYCKRNGDGQQRNGRWVCYDCWPKEGGLVSVRKCDACGTRNCKGMVHFGRYLCERCLSFMGAMQQKSQKYKRKKKDYKVVVEKSRATESPKKLTPVRYRVVLVEISVGKL